MEKEKEKEKGCVKLVSSHIDTIVWLIIAFGIILGGFLINIGFGIAGSGFGSMILICLFGPKNEQPEPEAEAVRKKAEAEAKAAAEAEAVRKKAEAEAKAAAEAAAKAAKEPKVVRRASKRKY